MRVDAGFPHVELPNTQTFLVVNLSDGYRKIQGSQQMLSELLINFKNLFQADNAGKKPVIIDAIPENLPVISAHSLPSAWSAFGDVPAVHEAIGAVSGVSCADPPRLKACTVLKQKDQHPLPPKFETWAHENSPWNESLLVYLRFVVATQQRG